jgi:HNH endonuclease
MIIEDYTNKWLIILEEMNNDNTYKLGWGRAIIEICSDMKMEEVNDEVIKITFKQIGKKMLKYYWNQIFYFNLKQSAVKGDTREPKIVQYTKRLIEDYKRIFETTKPEWFNKVYPSGNKELNQLFKRVIERDILTTLKSDVCWRFPKVKETEDIGVYSLYKKEGYIELNRQDAIELKENSRFLTQLFNYKWSLLLEKYNYAPKIGNKVKGSGDEEIRRRSLQSFKKILLLQFGENQIRDFYTNEIVPMDEISIDHVIPWSFIYDDDIWNLVVTSKSYNSSKNNHIISEQYIEKLEKRNEQLLDLLVEEEGVSNKYLNDLKFAIENSTVKELYNYFKG